MTISNRTGKPPPVRRGVAKPLTGCFARGILPRLEEKQIGDYIMQKETIGEAFATFVLFIIPMIIIGLELLR